MDITTDLTSQTVCFITVLQDICREEAPATLPKPSKIQFLQKYLNDLSDTASEQHECPEKLSKRIGEIVWTSLGPENFQVSIDTFVSISLKLLEWLAQNTDGHKFQIAELEEELNMDNALWSYTPQQWRLIIQIVLYKEPFERISLINALHYMPVQVIFSMGKRAPTGRILRLYQVWSPEGYAALRNEDRQSNKVWWDDVFVAASSDDKDLSATITRKERAIEVATSDHLLLKELLAFEHPLPFESTLNLELNEINDSRKKRSKDLADKNIWNYNESVWAEGHTVDPYERARKMNLIGLAFSGGGIRSATFNLGVLQKLAEKDVLPKVDYLSTVSGGGYIGSWLSSWIKRSGSVAKVSDRLNSRKSSDPMADEVRPIRWLKMYSNYLTPNVSVMSADSWTMGITWLRNTLINQIILLLLLCAGLAFFHSIFEGWRYLAQSPSNYSYLNIAVFSLMILFPGSLAASFGMRLYDEVPLSRWSTSLGKHKKFSLFVLLWAVLTAYLVSTWLYTSPNFVPTAQKFDKLLIPGSCAFVCILMIALIGNYQKCSTRFQEHRYIWLLILASSAIAAAAGVIMLVGIWNLFDYTPSSVSAVVNGISLSLDRFTFLYIIGIPLVLEVISCCVIMRMVLMGKLFPDERREWWGRMGAILHRFIAVWIVATICILALPSNLAKIAETPKVSALLSWSAIIGYAVKLAYNSGKPAEKNSGSLSLKEYFIRFAPYLFILGFLLIGTYVYNAMYQSVLPQTFIGAFETTHLSNALILAAITYILSWRVGVNEFSLHHFYRNRLVRAYLGATRRRTDRERSANNFTGFDKADDIGLSDLTVDKGYNGPFSIINTALNATFASELDRQDRKAESFVFTPLFCGYDFSPTRSAAFHRNQSYDYGYRPTASFAYPNGPKLGTAMAISGAAVNPNMGFHSSAATAFLLTVFNVRLGWWIGNPRLNKWKHSDPTIGITYIMKDLIGKSHISSDFVCLSDGGHFDNMGLYELVRRRCSYIILGDAEEDVNSTCEGLANAIRRCRIDFGVEISLNPAAITTKDEKTGYSTAHVAEGCIWYPGDNKPSGKLIYIKSSLTGDEAIDIREYDLQNPKFPQQSTGDQFFDEAQFDSYRRLGYHSVEHINFDLPVLVSHNIKEAVEV